MATHQNTIVNFPSLLDAKKWGMLCPMDDDQSKMFFNVIMASKNLRSFNEENLNNSFMYQLITKRWSVVGIKKWKQLFPMGIIVMACFLSGGNPGRGVMWAYTLKELLRRTGRPLTIEDFAHPDVFGDGFPSEEAYTKVWHAQKGYNQEPKAEFDNGLDLVAPWHEGLK